PGELWVTGYSKGEQEGDNQAYNAHLQGGVWTTTQALGGSGIGTLHMESPTDGWLMRVTSLPSIHPICALPGGCGQPHTTVMHFDGTAWKQAQVGADPRAGSIVMFTHTDGWAFELVPTDAEGESIIVNLVQHYHNGHWETTPWPFGRSVAYFQIFRVSNDEAWATGETLDARGESTFTFFHYSEGVWTKYVG